MKADGVEHAIAFSQYPKCCSTTADIAKRLWHVPLRLPSYLPTPDLSWAQCTGNKYTICGEHWTARCGPVSCTSPGPVNQCNAGSGSRQSARTAPALWAPSVWTQSR